MSKNNSLTTFNKYLTHNKTQDYLVQVLGARKEQFVTNCISLVSNDQALQNCEPNTIMYSAMKATSLGLPLDNNLGFAYCLPYNNTKKGVQECQFQIGYKGIIQLCMRSGQFLTINVTDVKAGEILGNDRLTGNIDFAWLPDSARLKAKTVGYIAYFELTNGFKKSLYMTVDELNAHGKKYSKSFNSAFSLWKKSFSIMSKKTVLKLLLSKYAPMSIVQVHDALKYDQAVIQDDGVPAYVDNEPDELDPKKIAEQKEFDRIMKHIVNSKSQKELDMVKDVVKDPELTQAFVEKSLEFE